MIALELDSCVDKLLFPGDVLQLEVNPQTRLGPGLCEDKEGRVIACKAGIFRRRPTADSKIYYWLDTKEKRVRTCCIIDCIDTERFHV